jgi:trans-2,3-dihydro-3-hydroxyanthranilate isomerase
MSDLLRQIRIVDVFTDRALAGNQLAVVLDGRDMTADLMQRIAREMNFSETTFILPPDDPAHAARVRIFNPGYEMKFAGHPTIGTAWVMHREGLVESMDFTLEEGVGPVAVRGVSVDGHVQFWMSHPALKFGEVYPHAKVASALAIDPSDIVHDIPAQDVKTGNTFLYVVLKDVASVDKATSDRTRIAKLLRRRDATGVYLFAVLGANRLYGRMFATDVAEDPATGSAAGPLGGFAVRYGLVKRAPKVSIAVEQGTKMGRQSFIHIGLEYADGEEAPSRIEVGGSVMPVLSGTLSDFGR